MENQFFKIDIPIYDVDVVCAISDDNEWIRSKFKENLSDDDFESVSELINLSSEDGCNISHRNNGSQIIIIRENPKKNSYWLAVLVHETLHATARILRHKNIEMDENSEEAFTYLQEYIFKNIYDELK